jgi:hypothetical protein
MIGAGFKPAHTPSSLATNIEEDKMPNTEMPAAAFDPYLEPGEQLKNVALGVKQPNFVLIVLLICLAVLPGVIAIQLLTRKYLVGLTDRRFIVLRFSGNPRRNVTIKEITDYRLSSMPQVIASTGPIFTHIRIVDPAKPFVAKFHRSAFGGTNRVNAMAIEAALTGRPLPAPAA